MWYLPWSESIKKRACRYLLQRYLGNFLEEKLTLDQLSVDLYNGTGTVCDVSLDCEVNFLKFVSIYHLSTNFYNFVILILYIKAYMYAWWSRTDEDEYILYTRVEFTFLNKEKFWYNRLRLIHLSYVQIQNVYYSYSFVKYVLA